MKEQLTSLLEILKDKYLTWRTGKNKTQRMWEEWVDKTIVRRAHTVENYYANFKYIIRVNPNLIWNMYEPFGWVTVKEFKQYEYPIKELGDNAVVNWFRVEYNQWSNMYDINEMYGYDMTFVATNNEQDALMITLKYA